MLLKRWIIGTIGCFIFANVALCDELADTLARNARLEATVQELTLQLAESLKERARLEAELRQALAREELGTLPAPIEASRPDEVTLQETDIVEEAAAVNAASAATKTPDASRSVAQPLPTSAGNCDVDAALKNYAGRGDDNKALSTWLKVPKRLAECSTAQLKQLRKAVDWDFWGYQKEVLALIDNELEKR